MVAATASRTSAVALAGEILGPIIPRFIDYLLQLGHGQSLSFDHNILIKSRNAASTLGTLFDIRYQSHTHAIFARIDALRLACQEAAW